MGRESQVTFFDSNILIYFLENNAEFGEAATVLLSDAMSNDMVGLSVLALTEMMSRDQTIKQIQKFKRIESAIQFVDIDKKIANLAGQLRKDHHSLKTPDAIHLATAISIKADLFITNYFSLAKVAKTLLPTKTL